MIVVISRHRTYIYRAGTRILAVFKCAPRASVVVIGTKMTTETIIIFCAVFAVALPHQARAAVTIDNVAVRLGLPEGQGLSGVCLYRNGPDKRRHVMFKSVTAASTRGNKYGGGAGGDHMVAGDLAADRVYEGTFARLEDGDQVARFGCKAGQRFEIATPFVVPERDLDTMLAVKESMERRFPSGPNRERRSVIAEHMSVTLRGLVQRSSAADQDAAVTVDVFRLYKKRAANTGEKPRDSRTAALHAYSAYPYARYALRYPVDNLMLADLQPDQMLAIKLRRRSSGPVGPNDNLTDNTVFIYTGGLYPRGTANLTEMLEKSDGPDDFTADVVDSNDDGEDAQVAAATSFQVDAKQAHSDSYGKHEV